MIIIYIDLETKESGNNCISLEDVHMCLWYMCVFCPANTREALDIRRGRWYSFTSDRRNGTEPGVHSLIWINSAEITLPPQHTILEIGLVLDWILQFWEITLVEDYEKILNMFFFLFDIFVEIKHIYRKILTS